MHGMRLYVPTRKKMKSLKSNLKSLFYLTTLAGVIVAVSTLVAAAQITPTNGIVYVTPGGTGNGSDWNNATSDLQGAINAALPDEGPLKVFVAVGIYYVGEQSFKMRNKVELYGGFDPGNGIEDLSHNRILPTSGVDGSVLDGQNERRIFYNDYTFADGIGNSAALDGFTLRRGYSDGDGGAIYTNWASPRIQNCVFSRNKAGRGGAVYNSNRADTKIENCIFKNNEAEDGGAIFNSRANFQEQTNCTFLDNIATRNGGAIYTDDFGGVIANNCTFESNRAAQAGGAMYTYKSVIELRNSTFNANRAKYGGGVYSHTANNDVPIDRCVFLGNRAEGSDGSGQGGGMYSESSHLTLTNCEFIYNISAGRGGGMYNYISSPQLSRCIFSENSATYSGGGMSNDGAFVPVLNYCVFSGNRSVEEDGGGMANSGGTMPRIINSIFYNNTAPRNGGGMFNSPGRPYVYNSLFAGNTAAIGGAVYNTAPNSFATIRNSVIRGNSDGVYNESGSNLSSISHSMVQGVPTGPNENINGDGNDPSFVNPADPIGPDHIWGTADDGFRLKGVSILRNRGSNTAYEEADDNNGNNSLQNDVDFIGERRLAFGTIDIGPYEFTIVPDANGIVYVRVGYNGNGSSWENATPYLHDAIDTDEPHKVFVASGVYGVGTRSFIMRNNVEIYGGFDPDNGIRGLSHNRIMPNPASNAGSVLDGEGERPVIWNVFDSQQQGINSSAVLDGFTITNGSHSTGGGIRNVYASPRLNNLVIRHNKATSSGAGIFNNNSSPVITNTLINRNEVVGNTISGAGIYNSNNSNPEIINVTIAGNNLSSLSGLFNGAGMYNSQSSPKIYNSIFWNNQMNNVADVPGADIETDGNGVLTLKNSITQGYTTGNPADYNEVNANPLFTDESRNNYSLRNNSPAINTGEDALYTSLNGGTKDLAGNPRVYDYSNVGRIDMGAYESSYRKIAVPDANGVVYVRPGYRGNGSSWENATRYLQDAIEADGPHKVFVASGIYGVGAHSFIMKNNVEIYGGFDPEGGIRDLTHERIMPDPANNAGSVLDGEGARPVIWNVFGSEAEGIGRSAVLDGFTITNGSNSTGSGVRNWYASPRLNNLVIRHNKATSSGAGVYNNYNSNPLITNTVIHSNEVEGTNISGAGIYNSDGSAPEIINVTIAGNKLITTGSAKGAGMYSYNASAKVYNSIFWNNLKMGSTDAEGADIDNEWSDITLKNSITQVYPAGNSEDNNKRAANPLFTNEAAGDYTLRPGSPAVDTGNSSLYPAPLAGPTDLAGNPRLIGGAIDIGAYENPDGALPVRWISFEGRLSDQYQAVLTWKTEETNVSHYEVERSADTKEFRVTGTVTAGGTGSGHYSHTDPAPVSGRVYYRVRQIDFDGTFSYSRMISLAAEGHDALFAYPNPMRERTMVELDDTYIGSTVSLINAAGIPLEQLEVKEATLKLDMQKYAPGMYLLRTSDGKVLRLIKE